jgi:hypothetical protein
MGGGSRDLRLMMIVLTLCYILLFGVSFPSMTSVAYLLLMFHGAHDHVQPSRRSVRHEGGGISDWFPHPMIILSITLWLAPAR